jgi:hypothetical protein
MKLPSGSSTADQGTTSPDVKVDTLNESCAAGRSGVGLEVGVGGEDRVDLDVGDREGDDE